MRVGIFRERAEGHEFDFGKGGHLRPLALAATYTCGHLLWRPLAATRLAASGCKWLQVVADEKSMRAATGGHSSGCKWLPMKNQMLVAAGGHWSGCKWPRKMWKSFRGRMSGGHLRPLEWLHVAANGCHFQNQITRLLRAQWEF